MPERAKELFFLYNGSRFYMDRDGVEREYASYKVPGSIERQWMKELTQQKLSALTNPGNWAVISFLSHHADYSHLPEILTARPLGKLWERIAFLEELLHYSSSSGEPAHGSKCTAVYLVLTEGARILKTARNKEKKQRVQSLLDRATGIAGSLNEKKVNDS